MSNDEMSTKPTFETLLTRMDEWGAQFSSELAEIKAGQGNLRESVDELRRGHEHLRTGQEDLRKGLEDLRTGQEDLRTGQEDLRKGLEDLRTGQKALRTEQEDVRKGLEDLRKGQEELRTDLNAGLRRVERKIEILNDNFLTNQADIRDLEVRVEKLESESLARK